MKIDLEDLVEELDELLRPRRDMMQSMLPGVIALEQHFELLPDHCTAGARRGHDVLVGLEDLDEPLRQIARAVVKPVVKERLPAAGLSGGEMNLAVEVLQDLGHRHANLRVELVGQAGDEQSDIVHWADAS